jgi:hypothetical protein
MPRKQTGGGRRGNPENLVPQFSQIAHALIGIDLPQDKQGLIDQAEANSAEPEILSIIEGLPERQYETMADVIGAAGESRGDGGED